MSVLELLSAVLAAVGDVWAFRAPARLTHPHDAVWAPAIGVAVLAGLSMMLGNVVVFAINRVSGLRMLAGMALGAVFMAVLRMLSATAIALAAWGITRGGIDGEMIAITYLFALAPLVLSFLVFVPHLGLGIARLLEIWSVLALVALLSPVLGVGRWPALAIAVGGWFLSQLLSRLLARPLVAVGSRVWTLATGHATLLTAQDILTGATFVPLERQERRP
ncbi:hypothetical protein [Pseudactinotalea suaedae]|uniref:hypothetical protein n=1 Tax=Pseudactinotalea suaedae TaxID=1524924 RepID=UPI0012E1ADAA|nr:hypothetical protein [Pseudactinotalea suaedae]